MRSVTKDEALRRRTHCQYLHGQGFVDHGMPPELPEDATGSASCMAPVGAEDGSVHVLKPPGAQPEMRMIWIAAESAWAPTVFGKGNRLAWTHDHLSRAGWRYVSALDDERPAKKTKRSLVRGGDSR